MKKTDDFWQYCKNMITDFCAVLLYLPLWDEWIEIIVAHSAHSLTTGISLRGMSGFISKMWVCILLFYFLQMNPCNCGMPHYEHFGAFAGVTQVTRSSDVLRSTRLYVPNP